LIKAPQKTGSKLQILQCRDSRGFGPGFWLFDFGLFSQFKPGFCRSVINNDMQNKHFLQTLYDGTRHLGLVKSQYEFGYICGKKESWLSCAKSVDRAMPLDAMVILAVSLENLIPARLPKSRQSEAKKLVRGLWDIIRAKAEIHTMH
jgi:hypothetical protein